MGDNVDPVAFDLLRENVRETKDQVSALRKETNDGLKSLHHKFDDLSSWRWRMIGVATGVSVTIGLLFKMVF